MSCSQISFSDLPCHALRRNPPGGIAWWMRGIKIALAMTGGATHRREEPRRLDHHFVVEMN